MSDHRVEGTEALIELLRSTADRLEQDDYGKLTGVVLVLEAVPGVFTEDRALTGTWTSMQGGKKLYAGLLRTAMDVAALRDAKGRRVQ